MLGHILSAEDTGLSKIECVPSLMEFKLTGWGRGEREATVNQQVNNLMN